MDTLLIHTYLTYISKWYKSYFQSVGLLPYLDTFEHPLYQQVCRQVLPLSRRSNWFYHGTTTPPPSKDQTEAVLDTHDVGSSSSSYHHYFVRWKSWPNLMLHGLQKMSFAFLILTFWSLRHDSLRKVAFSQGELMGIKEVFGAPISGERREYNKFRNYNRFGNHCFC